MIELLQGDCLELMKNIPDESIDMILCDPPYGVTACKLDVIIDSKKMFDQYRRIIKFNGAICVFGQEPFSSTLLIENKDIYKYDWYWKKTKPNGFVHCKNRPMACVENISIFSKAPMGHVSQLGGKRMNYNPQGISYNGKNVITQRSHGRLYGARPKEVGVVYDSYTNFPRNVLEFSNGNNFFVPQHKRT